MRRLVTGCLGLLLAGLACGAPDEGPSVREPLAEVGLEGKVCPGTSVVEGIDVSYYQKNIDWAAVKAAGREFAIVRVSDGADFKDPDFAKNWAGAKAAGLIRGTYQFFEPAQSAADQAKLVLDAIGNKLEPGDLPPTLDIEATGGQSAAKVAAGVKTWVQMVESALGRKPILYTGRPFWVTSVGDPPGYGGYPLWLAAYPYCYDAVKSGSYCPNIPDQWSSWTFWQYSDGENTPNQGCKIDPPKIGGVAQSCDRDFFNGTLAELQALAQGGGGGGTEFKATYVSQTYPLASADPVPATVGQVLTGSVTFKNTGSKPWSPGKTFLAPIPRDQASPFHAPSWPAPDRTGTVDHETAPGEQGTFALDLQPSEPGDASLFFGLVQEGTTWFADPPLGGGPADDVLEVKLSVKPGEGTGGAAGAGGGAGASGKTGAGAAGVAGGSGSSGHAGASGKGGASGASAGAAGASGKGGGAGEPSGAAGKAPEVTVTNLGDDDSGGCSCRTTGTTPGRSSSGGLVGLGLLAAWRRRTAPSVR